MTDKKKMQFAILRNDIVGASCKGCLTTSLEYRKLEKLAKTMEEENSIEDLSKSLDYKLIKRYLLDTIEPNIRETFLENLEWIGFDRDNAGTKHLATIATILFHERKLYSRSDITDKSYFDLSDFNNEHYGMLGLPKEKVIYDILNTNKDFSCPYDLLIYDMVDKLGYYGFDVNDEKRKAYSDIYYKKKTFTK